ncbi:MAG: SusC/RagA family TonB-linked outer membrane protein [Marinifilaceae bacterium]|jgi:TonB-linked SusC/RagA family outer membrane protein|nr:SusC/RagA family TonB-linked outer membrane protein [Marinifilaceae bacterium]
MNKKIIISYIIFFCLLSSNIFAQSQKAQKSQEIKKIHISGTVISEADKQPVIGGTVLVKGTTNGVAVDLDGKFKIVANRGDFLVVSCIGFVTQEVKVDGKNKYNIKLKADNVALKEIAVVGYGIQERRDLTGSVTSIKVDAIDNSALSIDNALSGQVAGVQINTSSGVPGSATAITIRGITSLGADNNPLFVIDGVPVYGTGGSATTSHDAGSVPMVGVDGGGASGTINIKSEFERNPLANLNMDDIESIEVLKDAYATAIYGSRGATGVILITTKKGKKGKPKVDINMSTAFASPVGTPDVMNGDQYATIYNTLADEVVGKERVSSGKNTDWFDAVSQTAITYKLGARVTAGTDKSSYFLSLSYLDRDSYIKKNDFQRYTARINYNYKSSEKLRFGSNVSVSYTDNNSLNSASVYRNSFLAPPNMDIKDEIGNYNFPTPKTGNATSPAATAETGINYVQDKRVLGNLYAEYKIKPWITYKSEFGLDLITTKSYNRTLDHPNSPHLKGGDASQTDVQNLKYVFNNTATIFKEFDEHQINAVFGQSFEKSMENTIRIRGSEFPSNSVMSIGSAIKQRVDEARYQDWAMLSFFGRVNYRLKDKYLFGVTYRVDGSSRFNENERFVGFPSFSAGWRISQEDFMQPYVWLNDLKLRASLGFSGISGSSRDYYGNVGRYTLRKAQDKKYGDKLILEYSQPSNPDLKWEKTRTLDIGLDMSLFEHRLEANIDYYYKQSIDMLTSSAVSYTTGFSSQQQNIVDMYNTGLEVSLNALVVDREIKWSANFNMAYNKNEITALNYGDISVGDFALGENIKKINCSATTWFLYDWVGVDPMTGNPLWKYEDGSTGTTPSQKRNEKERPLKDKFDMGDRLPKLTGGLTNTLSYRNWNLTFLTSFSFGSKIMNGTKASLYQYTSNAQPNLSPDILNYWLLPGHKTDIPKLNHSSYDANANMDYSLSRESDRFLESGDFVRLKNVSLSYNIPIQKLKKYGLNKANVFLKATNIYTWTDYSGPDPEVNAFGSSAITSGMDELTIPQQKSIEIGIRLGLQ